MMWTEETQLLIGLLFLFSSAATMISIAVFGYFVTMFVCEIRDAESKVKKEHGDVD